MRRAGLSHNGPGPSDFGIGEARRGSTLGTRDELTKREKEVVLELLDGGRVATIAELFGLSPRTVGNHVKSAFSKLDVHSQPELIELARSDPSRLGLTEALRSRAQLAQSELESRCEQALQRMFARIEAAHRGPRRLSQLRAAVRAALPLDSERRRDWRDWLELKSRSDTDGTAVATTQHMIDEWRDSTTEVVASLQRTGAVRTDLEPREVLRSLGALALGAGTRLLGNASERSVAQELRMIDGFLDALAGPAP